MAIGTTNISMANIYGEVNNTLPGGTNNSLKTLSQSATNTAHTSTISGYTSPGGGLTGAPYGMGEFGGYVSLLPYNSLTRNGANNTGDFVDILSYANGFGALAIDYQIVHMSIDNGNGTYSSVFYLEETGNGLGAYTAAGSSGSAMTTGTLYPIHTATFNSADWPDSYQIDISHSSQFGGGGAYNAAQNEVSGTGESHTSGTNWDNSVFTLMSPSGTNRTAFKEVHSITGECWTGTYVGTDTITFKYNRSGYPQLVITSFTVLIETDFQHTGICP